MSTTTIATESITIDTPIVPAAERTPDLRELTLIEICPGLKPYQIGDLINNYLPAIRKAHQPPTRPFNFIRFDAENKCWQLMVFKEATEHIVQLIREAEETVIEGFSTIIPESNIDTTKIVLSRKSELHRKDFSARVTFNAEQRCWKFWGKTKAALNSLVADWKELHDECLNKPRRPFYKKVSAPAIIRPYQGPVVPKFDNENFPTLNGSA